MYLEEHWWTKMLWPALYAHSISLARPGRFYYRATGSGVTPVETPECPGDTAYRRSDIRYVTAASRFAAENIDRLARGQVSLAVISGREEVAKFSDLSDLLRSLNTCRSGTRT